MILLLFNAIKATILGMIEGFTEFLPISSTGHLILANQFISFEEKFTLLFDVFIQLAAILAVLVYFRKKLWPLEKNTWKKDSLTLWGKTLVGVLPAIIFGALFATKIEERFFNPWTVAIALLVGGLIILWIEKRKKIPRVESIDNLTFKTALLIGLIQCLALIPGTSRSAATIMGALVLGCSRVVATEFSFFLAVPTMFAASAWSLLNHGLYFGSENLFVLIVGFAISFLTALTVIKFLINYVQKNNFIFFGWYRIVLGIIIILYFVIK